MFYEPEVAAEVATDVVGERAAVDGPGGGS